MKLWKPTGARIIVLPHGQDASSEFSISRRLIIAIELLVLFLALLVLAIVLSYGGLLGQARQVPRLQADLLEAQAHLVRVREINAELETMRGIQQQVLTMLGAQEGLTAADNMDAAGGAVSYPDGPFVTEPVVGSPPDRWPVCGYVTNEFKEGKINAGERPHTGIDIVAPVGTGVVASGAGVVQRAGWDDYLGNYVEIRHGFGYVTTYGHCAGLEVVRGDRVGAGDRIATLGGSGQVSAPHLHFEIWRDGQVVDPRLVISGNPDYTD